MKILGVVHFIA